MISWFRIYLTISKDVQTLDNLNVLYKQVRHSNKAFKQSLLYLLTDIIEYRKEKVVSLSQEHKRVELFYIFLRQKDCQRAHFPGQTQRKPRVLDCHKTHFINILIKSSLLILTDKYNKQKNNKSKDKNIFPITTFN